MRQLGRCAFTAACNVPGPRYRISGTNREVCVTHARTFQLAMALPASPADTTAFSSGMTARPTITLGKKG